jgi:hypothetical protein
MNLLELASIIFFTPYGRGLLMTVLGIAFIVAGFSQRNEASTYQQGAVAYSLENPAPIQYDYLKLEGRTNGDYSIFETKDKAYGIFYTLYTPNTAPKSPAAAIVKAWLPYEKIACVQQKNCLQAGSISLVGKGSSDPFDLSSTSDNAAEVFAKFNQNGLTNAKTVYLLADWQPSTGGNTLMLNIVGGLLLTLGSVSFVLGRLNKAPTKTV